MNKIVEKKHFSEKVVQLVVEAPLIARSRRAGHFVIVRADEHGERIPLTIADSDTTAGTITLVVQAVGKSTKKICDKAVGDSLHDVVGPLGQATKIEKVGTVVCCGGGVGVAPLLPIIRAMKQAGNRVVSVLAGRTKDLIILEDEVRRSSDEVVIMTDDGSYGEHGFVTVKLQQLLESGRQYDEVLAIGPIPMMKFVSKTTEPFGVKTIVSLNPIMVDGTGMCGGCPVTLGGDVKFACVDGPDFEGHKVDYAELMNRNTVYREREAEVRESHKCRMQKMAEELIK